MNLRITLLLSAALLTGFSAHGQESKPQRSESSQPKEGETIKAPDYDGPTLAAFNVMRHQTKTSISKLTKFLNEHKVELQSMSDQERDEFFDKHIKLAAANTLQDTPPSSTGSASSSSKKSDEKRGQRGPPPEVRAKFEALTEAGKAKVKTLFRENRDKLQNMSEEQRRSFLEEGFKKIVEQDGKPAGKSAAPNSEAPNSEAPNKPAKISQ